MTHPSHAALVEEVAAKIATHDMFDEREIARAILSLIAARLAACERERDEAKAREAMLNDEFMTSSANADDKLEVVETCVNDIYFMMTGRSSAWSNTFGLPELFVELKEVRRLLGDTITHLTAELDAARARP